jgi:hypothetical protein
MRIESLMRARMLTNQLPCSSARFTTINRELRSLIRPRAQGALVFRTQERPLTKFTGFVLPIKWRRMS